MAVRYLLRRKTADIITIAPEANVAQAVALLMRHNIGGLPVVRGDGVVGLIAERDLVRALDANAGDISGLTVERVMRRPAPTCNIDEPLQEVMARMTRERFRHLIVLENGRIAGVLSVGDLVKYRLDQLEVETSVLRDHVTAQRFRD